MALGSESTVLAREFNLRSPAPMNIYMPGIVKTKILANEPQPMKPIIKLVYWIKGVSVEESAKHVVRVMRDIEENKRRGVYYSVKKLKLAPELETKASDSEALWDLTENLLGPYLNSPGKPQGSRLFESRRTARTSDSISCVFRDC